MNFMKVLIPLLFFLISLNVLASSTIEKIPSQQQSQMQNVSWRNECPINLNQLVKVTVPYWGFDQQSHEGVLVVNKKVAQEVVEIFQEIYAAKFPIEKMNLIENYNGDDDLSMADDNTSAFNCRNIPNSAHFSLHSYGLAIDINPLLNPYVRDQKVLPSNARKYLDRQSNMQGMIHKDDAAYLAFKNRGWTWGGDWKYLKDYGHFEKN